MTVGMDQIRQEASRFIPKEYIPELIRINDLSKPIFYGFLTAILNKEDSSHE